MAKEKEVVLEEQEVPAVEAVKSPPKITIEEFCSLLSKKDKRVEMLGGFHFYMKKIGMKKEIYVDFLAAYEAFQRMPA